MEIEIIITENLIIVKIETIVIEKIGDQEIITEEVTIVETIEIEMIDNKEITNNIDKKIINPNKIQKGKLRDKDKKNLNIEAFESFYFKWLNFYIRKINIFISTLFYNY
jgi:hypothetical protein